MFQALAPMWPPTTLLDVVNGDTFTAIVFLFTGGGLLCKQAMARTSALGCLVLFAVGLPGLALWAIFDPTKMASLMNVAQSAAEHMPPGLRNSLSGMNLMVTTILMVWVLGWIFYRHLKSDKVVEEFGETLWLGSDFILFGFDLKVYTLAALLLGAQISENWRPPPRAEGESPNITEEDVKKLVEEAGELTLLQVKPAPPPADDPFRVVFGQFSTNEQEIALFANNGQLYRASIRDRKVSTIKIEFKGAQDRIMLSGDFHYAYLDREVTSLDDLTRRYSLPPGHIFWGFSAVADHALIYDKPNHRIALFDFVNQKSAFEIEDDLGEDADLSPSEVVWSPSRKSVLIPLAHAFRLIDVAAGKNIPVEIEKTPARRALFSATDDYLIYGGENLDGSQAKGFLFNLASGQISPLALPDVPIGLTGQERAMVVLQNPKLVQARQLKDWSRIQWQFPLPKATDILMSQDARWLFWAEDQSDALQYVDLSSMKIRKIATQTTPEPMRRPPQIDLTKSLLFGSDRGNLVAFAHGRQLDVYWLSEMAKATPGWLSLDLLPPLLPIPSTSAVDGAISLPPGVSAALADKVLKTLNGKPNEISSLKKLLDAEQLKQLEQIEKMLPKDN